MKPTLALLLVLLFSAAAQASVIRSNLGLDVLVSRTASVLTKDNKIEINLNDDMNLDNSSTAYEFYGGIKYDNLSVRVYHFLPTSRLGSGTLRSTLQGLIFQADPFLGANNE